MQENDNNKSKYVVRLLAGTKEIDTKNMTNAPNLYFDWNYWNVFLDAYMIDGITTYYVKLLNANGVSLSNPPQPVEFTQIAKREYAIEYSYASGYNVFDYGTITQDENMQAKINNAFAQANTKIIMSTNTSNLSAIFDYDVWKVDYEFGTDGQLQDWIWEKQSGGSNADHNHHLAPLFSIRDLHFFNSENNNAPTPEIWINVQAKTFHRIVNGQPAGGGGSIVFIDRVQSLGITGDKLKRQFDATVVHELGHQRGIYDEASQGHNGFGKYVNGTSICVIFYPADLPNEAQKDVWRKTPTFCEGHRQKLLNCVW